LKQRKSFIISSSFVYKTVKNGQGFQQTKEQLRTMIEGLIISIAWSSFFYAKLSCYVVQFIRPPQANLTVIYIWELIYIFVLNLVGYGA